MFNNIIIVIFVCGVLSFKCKSESNRDLPSERQVHKCKLTNKQYAFDILPGSGWDNLENKELGQVLEISYKECLTSNDGSFLIPDNSVIIPIKRSTVELASDIFDHFSNFTSATSKSINADASYATPSYQISGSFSWEKKDVKNDQIKEKSLVSRVQLRHEFYTVSFQPDSKFDRQFKNRILDIGALLKEGKDTIYPQYLADLIVRDFGTHVIRSVDAGATLIKTDVLKSKYVNKFKGDTTTIAAAASFSMTKVLGVTIKGNYFSDTASLDEYNNNSASTKVETVGGRPFGSNFKLEDWEKSLDSNLVAIDRRGNPLFYAITPRSLPEFDDKTVNKIVTLIKNAVNRYYAANTRVGCMNMESENFNDDANIDGGNCETPKSYYTLGGTFQTCKGPDYQCENVAGKNPITNSYACPANYKTVELESGLSKCEKVCVRNFWFSYNCHYECSYYALYWCAATKATTKSEGSLFGGFYSNTYPNPITNAYNCPQYYYPSRFGMVGTICLAFNRAETMEHHLPFGGFYSCKVGNPLSDKFVDNTTQDPKYWSEGCATGYSSHVAIVNRGCQISYCIKNNALSRREQPPLFRPPFVDLGFGPNATITTSLETPTGLKLSVDENGKWSENKKSKSSNYNIIIFSVTAVAIITIMIIILILGIKIHRKTRRITVLPEYNGSDRNNSTSSLNNPTASNRVQPFKILIDENQ